MTRPLGFVLAVPLCLVASTRYVSSAPTAGTVATVNPAAAIPHAGDQELRPGDQLIQVLKDKRQPRVKRAAAAEELGRLRYLPAIPVLFENITMWPVSKPGDSVIFHENGHQITYISDSFDDNIFFSGPCVDALRQYGAEVIPQAIKRYLSPQFRHHRGHLQSVLRGRDQQVQDAIRAVRPTVTDPQQMQLLTDLYKLANGDMTDFERPPGPKPWERPRDAVGYLEFIAPRPVLV
jgi:hypothetical protein